MGTAVIGFASGLLAGALLVACGGGEAVGPGRVMVCAAGDRDCQSAAVLGADRVCRLMPAGLVLYMGHEINDAMLRADLEERGFWRRTGAEWIEGEDCV